ncbi:hypothetical protein C5167_048015 [Papaver somniferum]|uniref:Glucose-6-phosphate 1-dehydrogenase n=1 Tax=Papaver somniferum TaxID=3469 RepID=A0A4Y7KGR0_PAPSO|nr:hypothetical protein C5167_048015 [Papaver somniferum]
MKPTLKTSDSFSEMSVPETGCLSIIVLGASGDLAKKKTFPALYNLYRKGFLQPNEIHIFGYARSKMSDDELRVRIRDNLYCRYIIKKDTSPEQSEDIKYVSGNYDSDEGFKLLDKEISAHELSRNTQEGSSRKLFYLALPPSVYPPVEVVSKSAHSFAYETRYLSSGALFNNAAKNSTRERKRIMEMPDFDYFKLWADLGGWTRVVIEKPFGKDLDTAEDLSAQLGELFQEKQIYRIDHYLGKELVQNLLVLRFANRLFLPLWNRDNIANVQIVFREKIGTEGRGGYFDEYGQVYLIADDVLCLVAMEKPISLKPDHIRDEKVKVLQSTMPISNEEIVLGQYEGYTDDPTVSDHSNTPTFATMILRIHNERWEGVPFIMKAGKALNSSKAEIRVQFKDVPDLYHAGKKQGRNEFVIRLQPKEAMYMKLTVKKPGQDMSTIQSELDLSYGQRYQDAVIPEAYERLILDTIRGDQQHFVRRDELKAAWEIFTPLLRGIDEGKMKPLPYKRDSRGPAEADELLEKAGYVQTHGYIWIPPTL